MADTSPSHSYPGGSVPQWQGRLRRKLAPLLGAWPEERVPLRVRTVWRRDHPLGTIEKIVFRSEPGADVPAFLCLPKGAAAPHRVMICLQGHTTGMHLSIGVERDDNHLSLPVEGDRDFGLSCLKNGFAALCLEQRSFGERREQKQEKNAPHGCHDAAMRSLMLGRTLLGERVFDVDRAIDYLTTRSDVDLSRIGVMGNSGGGTVSIYAAALLPRLAFAMPSCSFCTFRDSIMSIYHCADNYVPGLYPVAEMADILGLFAPKPVVIVAGRDDKIFPLRGTRHAFRNLQTIYSASGAPDRCQLVVGKGGHRFYADDAWPVLHKLLGTTRQK